MSPGCFRSKTAGDAPSFGDLDKIEMFSEGLTAPLFQGALESFGEAKLR